MGGPSTRRKTGDFNPTTPDSAVVPDNAQFGPDPIERPINVEIAPEPQQQLLSDLPTAENSADALNNKAEEERKKARSRASTILTSGRGLQGSVSTARRTLLGA